MLRVLGRRNDGYHLLQTVFQFLEQADALSFQVRNDRQIHCTPALPGVSDDRNLAILAARLLQRHTGYQGGADIHIRKQLPMGGGLGGGSSNAATTLVILNKLWNLDLGIDELAGLGLQLGADVPIFIHGRSAWAEGIGEKMQFFQPQEPWYLVLTPDCHVSTAKIFCDPQLTRDAKTIKIRDFIAGRHENTLQSLVAQRHPKVAQALSWLDRHGEGRLTGTGACVFGEYPSRQKAEQAHQQLPADMQGFVSRGSNISPLHTQYKEFFGAWPSG
ncbi:4-diphosphocytidyl-2-C-methyl-D-erythritol kinase [Thiolapillus brandeum]|uniref:4-diphosphocytidyl-2-C-methyl-D-erythritol kinase n=2 Tax=Thiolapillus brandeum TaxID=1076588 RepID=A0A7U6GGL5_9GAMM|nr:4-diphosphocytidyl-2-C-methyl-D-erythritol kinase [Thiolapillus brandeum]